LIILPSLDSFAAFEMKPSRAVTAAIPPMSTKRIVDPMPI